VSNRNCRVRSTSGGLATRLIEIEQGRYRRM
jgi:hypothetical protein